MEGCRSLTNLFCNMEQSQNSFNTILRKILNGTNRLANIIVYRWGYFSFLLIYKLFFRMKVYGSENIPSKGACIIASNHQSFLDPPIVGTSNFRELYYFARSSLMRTAFTNILFRLWNCIPVDRDNPSPGTLKKAIQVLKQEKALLLFPEGTRSLDGTLQQGKMGIGFIAHKVKCPIVPVYIDGSYNILPKGSKWPKFTKLKVQIGKSFSLEELYQKKGSEEVYQSISDQVMDTIRDLKNKLQSSTK
jgi:1-acyl-sn-glycerol-3-phosphate acyltransferase